ncbi:hypothetical protein BH09ACT10_BH09ACT10_04920 [soil metagenome]
MKKLIVLAAVAVGYVLGARAGRERYEQIKRRALKLWNSPSVQQKVDEAEVAVKHKASDVGTKVADAASFAGAKAAGVASDVGTKVADKVGLAHKSDDFEVIVPEDADPFPAPVVK